MKVSRSAFAGLLLVCAATTTTTTTTTFVTCNEDAEVGAPSHRRSQRSVRGGMIQPSNDNNNNKGQEDHEPKMKKLAMDLIDEKLLQQQNVLQQGGEHQRSLQSVTRCGLEVEIEKCIALVGGTPVSCDEIPSGVCKVDVAFSYNVVNTEPESPSSAPSTSFAPSTSSGKTSSSQSGKGKAGKGGGMSNDDDEETVTLAFIGEAFNPQPSSTCPSDDAFLLPTGVVLAPGESKRFATNVFSVDICECPEIVFGVGLGAVGGCVAADVVKIGFGTASSQPSAAPSECSPTYDAPASSLPKQGGMTDWYLAPPLTSCDAVCIGLSPRGTCTTAPMANIVDPTTFNFVLDLFDVGSYCPADTSVFPSSAAPLAGSTRGRYRAVGGRAVSCRSLGRDVNRFCCCGTNCPFS